MGAQNGFSWKQVAGSAIAQPLIEAIGDSILGTRAEGPQGLTRTNVPEFAGANPGIANVLTRSLQGAMNPAQKAYGGATAGRWATSGIRGMGRRNVPW